MTTRTWSRCARSWVKRGSAALPELTGSVFLPGPGSRVCCSGVAPDHHKDGRQRYRERSGRVVRYRPLADSGADDSRSEDVNAAEHQHDSKPAGSKTQLAPEPS